MSARENIDDKQVAVYFIRNTRASVMLIKVISDWGECRIAMRRVVFDMFVFVCTVLMWLTYKCALFT